MRKRYYRIKHKIKNYFRELAWKIRVKELDFIYDSLELFDNFDETVDGYKEIEKVYLGFLKFYCKRLKLNYKTTLKVLFGLYDLNWKRLHETEEEGSESSKERLETFRYEYSYIADRYSYTRMLRAHWLWLTFTSKFFDEYNKENGLEWRDDNYINDYDWFDKLIKKA